MDRLRENYKDDKWFVEIKPRKEDDRDIKQRGSAHAIAEAMNDAFKEGQSITCKARAISDQVVVCDIFFPSGASDEQVLRLTKKFVNVNRGLPLTIYVAGYIEGRKVCEWKYDMFTGDVSQR